VADPYRLPTQVTPSHYALTLEPDLDAATFAGEVTIQVDAHEPTGEITLNAIELDLLEATVDGIPADVTLDADTERATLHVPEELAAGPHTIHIRYTGILNDKLHGFYLSRFTDAAEVEHTIATTQFEATDARRAFPCWDEPEHKATFAVTLDVPDHLLAVSNGPIVADEPVAGSRRRLTFDTTMKMSTYLVAFAVGPFVATDPVDVDGVPLRVIAPAERIGMADFALEAGAFALRTFADFFGIPYPGGKLDLVAIPDFAFGAMENLGCVTFRETALLVDQSIGSQVDLQRVADVVNHEIAHMWFGDLVTMKWWNGIWLNEAFATFMELKATDAFRPEWDRWTAFGLERGLAFGIDALNATRPIEFDVTSPAEAEGMFDVLTYQKGCAVMRMLEQYVGEDGFREGLRLYMRRHAYGNTETGDLWDAIETATGEPVHSMMDSWILQGGHPLVSVAVSADGTALTLTQERFRFLADEPDDTLWSVPVLVRTPSGDTKVLLTGPTTTVDLGTKADWVVVNAGASGFYRTMYSSALLRSLLANLDSAALAPLERFMLVSDTWAAARAGLAPVSDFVEVCRALAADDDPDVWSAINDGLTLLARIARDDEARAAVARLVVEIAAPALARVGWEPTEDEGNRRSTLRGVLVSLLGGAGDDVEVQARCRALLDLYLADRSSVHPDLLRPILSTAATKADEATYERILDRWRNAATPQEEIRFLGALSLVLDPELFQRTIDLYLSDDVKTQDAALVVAMALKNRANGRRAWAAVHAAWDDINGRLPSNTISRLVGGLADQADPALAADARGFLSEHPLPQGAKQVDQTLEAMDVNARFAEREADHLSDL
jgi:puromycin-sensitive aminopeptidase